MEDSNTGGTTPRNIAVLNFGTNDKKNCVTILETALYLTEKYLGKGERRGHFRGNLPSSLKRGNI